MNKIVQPNIERPMQVKRFWGSYLVLDYINLSDKETELTKRLHIDAGKGISYQRHAHRDEIWTIADGEGYFVLNGERQRGSRGDVLIIKAGNLHAIRAIKPLIIIEVQLGNPLVEEDIERFDFDWDKIFEGASWFHVTGITPALSESAAEITVAACKKAKEKGITVSCDLNYRKKLWSREKAGQIMAQLMPYVDVCIANEEDAADVFGIHAEETDIESGKLNYDGYISVAHQLSQRFGCGKVAITLRGSISATENTWAGMLYDSASDCASFSKSYYIFVVDRVGGGDSFGGGLIYALSQGYSQEDAINFAVAASCLKHTIEHDFNQVTVDEVRALMNGSGSGRVQR